MERALVEQQLSHTLESIRLEGFGDQISGKVRESYVVGDKRILIASDRLSAFDRILTTIPFKGQLLTQLATHWFEETQDIVPNHLLACPHPNVMITQQVDIVPIEMVIRGYLTGSAWRDYEAGRPVSGIQLEQGLRRSQRFPEPLITPSTKAEHGEHDEPISEAEILRREIVDEALWSEMADAALKLFRLGTERAAQQGLILVDTKYEFGTLRDENGKRRLVLADEVHTQDSSRYWMLESYEARFEAGEDPHMLDKEFVRRMLIEKHSYMGDGEPPVIENDFRVETALRYIEAYETMTGKTFEAEVGDPAPAIQAAVESYFQN